MPARETRGQARRRIFRRRRQVALTGLLLSCALLLTGGFRLAAAFTEPSAGQGESISGAGPKPAASPSPTASGVRNPTPGSGVYTLAAGATARHGSGKLVTYRVEMETGIGQSAPVFAAAVDATLADESGWTSQGRWSMQRVAGEDADLVIRLATSATVGAVCEAAGLEDAAYASCRTGHVVMINLDRWMHAVPEYRGDVALYRQYLINHEVGHGLGLGHQSCPGPGRPAPVMQQQTLGLKGCLANGSPYVAGKLVSGPATS
jgi:hypothetical protein